MIKLIQRLAKSTKAIAAVEFALIAPIMITLWCGVVETSYLLMAKRKLVATTYSCADLVAQERNVNSSNISDIISASKLIMLPFPDANLNISIVYIEFDPSDGDPEIDWSEPAGSGSGLEGEVTGMGGPGDKVVVVETSYDYKPLFADMIIGNVTLTERAFAKPRFK
ncbi:MAG: pilus assembly protein [Alphaproteobacteria bacterium]|nr:pilus assembly protein [Alphaproteobacteria bacterium]